MYTVVFNLWGLADDSDNNFNSHIVEQLPTLKNRKGHYPYIPSLFIMMVSS
jgi:hypothetical protein